MRLILEGYQPISNNKAQRMHWSKRQKAAEDVHWLVKQQLLKILEAKGYWPCYPKASIRFKVYLSTARAFDPDNFFGGSGKWIIDALKKEGIIVDDSHKHVKLSVEFHVDKANPGVEIVIEEV